MVVVIVGGGEGMGPIEQTARAIDESGLNVALVIVAGRNEGLKRKLDARDWNIPVRVYGFTRELPDFMRAADVLITKAGPGTIAESLNAGLPIILNAKVPGQEDGNVTFVQREHVGVWAPTPQRVVQTLTRWVDDREERERYISNCKRVARPNAARTIAHFIAVQAGIKG
jgi:1,2-diacylglycerol 3-beta-galactosyltransferase